MANPFWTASIPVWSSRKTANGHVTTWSVTGWIFMLIGLTVTVNAIIWPLIGIYEAVRIFA